MMDLNIIESEIAGAMRSGDSSAVNALRNLKVKLILSAKRDGKEPTPEAIVDICRKHKEELEGSMATLREAGDPGALRLVSEYAGELSALDKFLSGRIPEEMPDADLEALVTKTLTEMAAGGALSRRDTGKAIAIVSNIVAGRAAKSRYTAMISGRLAEMEKKRG